MAILNANPKNGWLVATGYSLKGFGEIQQGIALERAMQSESTQLRQQAGQTRASSQRAAAEERRKGDLLLSRARAVAAASGGGADDPTVQNIEADIASQSEYRALTAQYEGEDQARGLEFAADTRRRMGRAYATSGVLSGAGTLLEGGTSLYAKYG